MWMLSFLIVSFVLVVVGSRTPEEWNDKLKNIEE